MCCPSTLKDYMKGNGNTPPQELKLFQAKVKPKEVANTTPLLTEEEIEALKISLTFNNIKDEG